MSQHSTPVAAQPDFHAIKFGISDAQTEAVRYPDLMINGYLDVMGMVESALATPLFLFLGYKGSGKSALSEHLQLKSKTDDKLILQPINMYEFPYELLTKVVKADSADAIVLLTAWSWILLLYAMSSLESDPELFRSRPEDWTRVIEQLRREGLFPLATIGDLVRKASKSTFGIDLKFVSYTHDSDAKAEYDVNVHIDIFKELIASVRTDKKHYIIIDGLDEFFTKSTVHHDSIASLIIQAKELNNWFVTHHVPVKIIVLCRTDIFANLSNPNINKIKQAFTFPIRWFDESEIDDYRSSALIQLANLRCRLKYPAVSDLFIAFFPKTFEKKPIRKRLLEYTRHTPRDFLQLLTKIQDSCKGVNVSEQAIYSGIKKYARDYFLDEIRDELAGYISSDHIQLFIELLTDLGKREFKIEDISAKAGEDARYADLDLGKIFTVLFNCSAIGHIKTSKRLLLFKYRNPTMIFSPKLTIVLHPALWKALI